MAKSLSPLVLILGQDSLRADRALAEALAVRNVEADDIVRIWGDESSFPQVFAAATSRSLFSDRTVVVVRRAERLRDAGKAGTDEDHDGDEDSAEDDEPAEAPAKARGSKGGKSAKDATPEIPELDATSCLILVARKVDRRGGLWRKVGKAAETIDADYLKGKGLLMQAGNEARALGLRIAEDVLRDLVEQSGPSLGRIVSELEKMALYASTPGRAADDIIATTSSPPLYLLSDAVLARDRKRCLGLLDDALRQGEHGLRVLATLHGSVRRLAMFRAARKSGTPAAEAAQQLGIMPFKVADMDRAARSWSDAEVGRALSVFAEVDRRLKLSGPASAALVHALARVTSGARA